MIEVVRADITTLDHSRVPAAGALRHPCGRADLAWGEAFPAISTGVYGFPKPRAAGIAVAAMREWEAEFERIVACLFDDESVALYRDAIAAVEE